MLLYHGMYNIAHFEINNSVPLYTNTAVGDAYDYKRLRKVCFESGGAYINDSIIDGGHVRGGAHVTIQEDSIFLSIVPEDPNAGIVYGLTFFIGADDRTMFVYAEKREGGGSGGSGVDSFNGRRGSVIPADGDYNAGMVGYDNTNSGLVADNTQDAIDELAQENENLSDDVEVLQQNVDEVQEDVSAMGTAITNIQDSLHRGLFGFKETITVVNNNYTDINSVRLADLTSNVITALGQLGDDEKALITYVNVANAIWTRAIGPATWLDNTITTIDMRFFLFNISTANNRADFQSLRLHPNSANAVYNRLRLETTPTITISDYSGGTNNNDMIVYIDVYKEVIS